MSQVFVTGATGFVGGHLVRELVAAGHAVRALSRSTAGDAVCRSLGAQPVRGDLGDTRALAQGMAACSAVFHAAADTSTDPRHRARQTETNVEGTRRLLQAAQEAGVEAFMFTSSISSYSHLVRGPLDEDTPQLGGRSRVHYERSKYEAEQRVRASPLPWTVFHPTHVLGPGDRQNWARVIRMIDQEALSGIPPGLAVVADVREVARAQLRAWERRRFGQTYLLGGEVIELTDLVHRIGVLLGKRTPRRASPEWVMHLVASVRTAMAHARGRDSELTRDAVAMACRRQVVSSGKAQRELDYRITPVDALLADTLKWMRAEGLVGSGR